MCLSKVTRRPNLPVTVGRHGGEGAVVDDHLREAVDRQQPHLLAPVLARRQQVLRHDDPDELGIE